MNVSKHEKQSGAAMVEFTIVIPLMLLLLLGVTELGRALVQYNTLTKGVRDGARHLATYGSLGSTGLVFIDGPLDTEARNLVVYGNTAGSGQPILQNLMPTHITTSIVGTTEVLIEANYPYTPMTGATLQTFGLGGPISLNFNMRASVLMRAL